MSAGAIRSPKPCPRRFANSPACATTKVSRPTRPAPIVACWRSPATTRPERRLWGLAQAFEAQGLLVPARNAYADLRDRFGRLKLDDQAADTLGTLAVKRLSTAPFDRLPGDFAEPDLRLPLVRTWSRTWSEHARPLPCVGDPPAPNAARVFLAEQNGLRPIDPHSGESAWIADLGAPPVWVGAWRPRDRRDRIARVRPGLGQRGRSLALRSRRADRQPRGRRRRQPVREIRSGHFEKRRGQAAGQLHPRRRPHFLPARRSRVDRARRRDRPSRLVLRPRARANRASPLDRSQANIVATTGTEPRCRARNRHRPLASSARRTGIGRGMAAPADRDRRLARRRRRRLLDRSPDRSRPNSRRLELPRRRSATGNPQTPQRPAAIARRRRPAARLVQRPNPDPARRQNRTAVWARPLGVENLAERSESFAIDALHCYVVNNGILSALGLADGGLRFGGASSTVRPVDGVWRPLAAIWPLFPPPITAQEGEQATVSFLSRDSGRSFPTLHLADDRRRFPGSFSSRGGGRRRRLGHLGLGNP